MMVVAVATLLLPTVFSRRREANETRIEEITVVLAVVLILLYAAGLIFVHRTHRALFRWHEPRRAAAGAPPPWSVPVAVGVLAVGAVGAGVAAEFIAHGLETAGPDLGLTKGFLGLVLIPVVGNAAEHFSALSMAAGNRLDVAAGIAIGSSLQIIMLVVPLFVFTGLITGNLVTLALTPLELAMLAASAIVVHYLVNDGRGNIMEGAQLVGLYVVFAAAAFFTQL